MPIIRRNEQRLLFARVRRWGFNLMLDGKTPTRSLNSRRKIKRNVINAMSEKLTSSYM